jgi:aminoacrylate hydrolase
MGDDIAIVLDALKLDRAHIVGHAAGGHAALSLALRAPRRVDRIVVVNGWSQPDPHIARCFAVRLALLDAAGPEAYVQAQPIFLYPANWISENDELLSREAVHQVAGFPPKAVMESRIQALLDFDIDARLPAIKAPVLVAAAADDMLVPSLCSDRLAARLPNAILDIVPWGGHGFTVTAPERFNRVLVAYLRGEALPS